MEPKFQSSFIPKGPITSTAASASIPRVEKKKSLLSSLALIIFVISVLAAVGVFGYKFYLNYRIDKMGADLEQARTALQPEIIRELTRIDNRIVSVKSLISRHYILTPLFEFLEDSTPKVVRFNDFSYTMTEQGLELQMKGEARGYAALALQADIFQKSQHFINPAFSDLNLNEKGDVNFSFTATIEPNLASYMKKIERVTSSQPVLVATSTDSTTSTSSPQVATSTPN